MRTGNLHSISPRAECGPTADEPMASGEPQLSTSFSTTGRIQTSLIRKACLLCIKLRRRQISRESSSAGAPTQPSELRVPYSTPFTAKALHRWSFFLFLGFVCFLLLFGVFVVLC